MKLSKLVLVFLAILTTNAFGFPVAKFSVEPEQKDSLHVIKTSLEQSLGESISTEQLGSIKAYTEAIESSPSPVLFGRDQTVLVCIGATAAYILKAQVAACSDLSGTPYFLQSVSYGAVFGLAGQVFAFAALHDSDQPIAPQFMVGTIGATAGRAAELFSILKGLSQIAPMIGPNIGAFHSVIGNQAGLLFGVNFGKIIGFDLGKILIYDSFSELVNGIQSGTWSIEGDEFKARIEARKKRLGMK